MDIVAPSGHRIPRRNSLLRGSQIDTWGISSLFPPEGRSGWWKDSGIEASRSNLLRIFNVRDFFSFYLSSPANSPLEGGAILGRSTLAEDPSFCVSSLFHPR